MQAVVLYGTSLALSTIEAGLQEYARVRVVRVGTWPADVSSWLAALDPAAVVFDRLATRPDFAIPLLDQHPDVLFVGVDPSSDRMLILSGRQSQPESAAELVRLIVDGSAGIGIPD